MRFPPLCRLGLLVPGASWFFLASVIALDRTGKGLRTAPRDAMITLTSTKANLATSFGVHRSMDAAGALAGPLVAFLILAAAPERFDIVFVVSFCVALVGLGVLVVFVDRSAIGTLEAAPERPSLPGMLRSLLGQRAFVLLSTAAVLLSIATMSDAFIYLTLQQRLQFAPSVFPLLYVATSLVYAGFAAPAGRLADRFGSRRVFLAGYVALGIVYVSLLLPGAGALSAVLGIAALGAYYAATDGVLMAIAGRLLPPAQCATGLAALATMTSLARLFSSVAVGWMWTTGDVATTVRVFGTALIAAIADRGIRALEDRRQYPVGCERQPRTTCRPLVHPESFSSLASVRPLSWPSSHTSCCGRRPRWLRPAWPSRPPHPRRWRKR